MRTLLLVFLSFGLHFFGCTQLDPTFNFTGIVKDSFPNTNINEASKILIQDDGKVIIIGSSYVSGVRQLTLIRYLSDGQKDLSFGTNGVFHSAYASGFEFYIRCAKLQSDGKILIGGKVFQSFFEEDLFAVRISQNGTFDTSFGTGGTLIWGENSNSNEFLVDIAERTDGKLMALIYESSANNNSKIHVSRMLNSGTFDTTFGTNGFQTTTYAFITLPRAISLDISQKIYVAVNILHFPDPKNNIFRYLENGTLDPSFGTNGLFSFNIDSDTETIRKMTVLGDNKVVLSGDFLQGGFDLLNFVIRLNGNGSFDTSFNGTGEKRFAFVGSNNYCANIGHAIQADGKIVVSGTYQSGHTMAALRLNSDGTEDNTFFGTGSFNYSEFDAHDMALQPDNKVLMIGNVFSFFTARFGPFDPNAELHSNLQAKQISVYPNPSSGKFFIKSTSEIARVEVIDQQGRLLVDVQNVDKFHSIDIAEYANGAYFLKILTTNNEMSVLRMVKE